MTKTHEKAVRLFEIRAELKKLQKEESELKEFFMSKLDKEKKQIFGAIFMKITEVNRKMVNTDKLKQEYAKVYEDCLVERSYKRLHSEKIK